MTDGGRPPKPPHDTRPPHPATVVQRKASFQFPGRAALPPHPATVVQPKTAFPAPLAPPPHPAAALRGAALQRAVPPPPPILPPPPPPIAPVGPPPVNNQMLGPTLESQRNRLPMSWLAGVGHAGIRDMWRNRYNYLWRVLDQYARKTEFFSNEGNLRKYHVERMDLGQFRDLVNAGWRKVVEPIADDRIVAVNAMFDPAAAIVNDSIVSSTRVQQGFLQNHIGFRGDTRAPTNGRAPVFNLGFRPRYALPGVEWGDEPHYVTDTIVAESMCINLPNMDFFNETGVCVSRCLFGATKFPSPDRVEPQTNWLYAIRVDRGFDTEAYQRALLNRKPTALWRPGEKALSQVAPENVLAGIEFVRRNYRIDADQRHVWFEFKVYGNIIWNNAANATVGETDYITREIAPYVDVWTNFWRRDDFRIA